MKREIKFKITGSLTQQGYERINGLRVFQETLERGKG
jgi:hypothetical protein